MGEMPLDGIVARWPSGKTRVAGLIGYPARYSLSPALHGAAYKALGLDIVYVVFPVQPQHVALSVEAMRALDLVGLSVTIPHKHSVISVLDQVAPEAQRLRAVNCIAREGDRLVGHNTDGLGFIHSLVEDNGFDPAGKRAVVIGAGGAARAVICGLADAGATDVAVLNRSRESAERAVDLAGSVARLGSEADLAEADLVVNATPVGMEGALGDEIPIPVDAIGPGQLVIDLIYHPSRTALLQQCAALGADTANGLGMLTHQAAEQVEIWTGMRPPIDVMQAAVS